MTLQLAIAACRPVRHFIPEPLDRLSPFLSAEGNFFPILLNGRNELYPLYAIIPRATSRRSEGRALLDFIQEIAVVRVIDTRLVVAAPFRQRLFGAQAIYIEVTTVQSDSTSPYAGKGRLVGAGSNASCSQTSSRLMLFVEQALLFSP